MRWWQWVVIALALLGTLFEWSVIVDSHGHLHHRRSLNLYYWLLFWLPQTLMVGATILRWWRVS